MTFKKIFKKFLLILSGLGMVFIFYCYMETRWLKIENIELISTDVPEAFSGKRIVFITDIHHGPFLSIKRVQKMVDKINKIQPDIILLGGDYVYRRSKYITPFFNEIRNLKSKYGIYGVLGNHDHYGSADLTQKMMERNGIKICDNDSHWLKLHSDSIKIGGVGDLWEGTQNLDKTIYDLKKTDFCMLISHNPDYIEDIQTDVIDFTVSGHTHGGQVTYFGKWAPLLPSRYVQKYRYGFKHFEKMQSYISSGVGTTIPPLRFYCRPEIVVIELGNKL